MTTDDARARRHDLHQSTLRKATYRRGHSLNLSRLPPALKGARKSECAPDRQFGTVYATTNAPNTLLAIIAPDSLRQRRKSHVVRPYSDSLNS